MKSFIFSICFFLLMLTGIVIYQYNLGVKTDEINAVINEIEHNVLKHNKNAAEEQIETLSDVFSKVKNWIMMFEDHDQILSMAQCIESMDAHCVMFDTNGILAELYKFKYLINYFTESVEPTIENIL